MAGLLISPAARQDLEDIWQYTQSVWNIDQADFYIRLLNDGFQRLVDLPSLGQDCSDIRDGYRKYQVERHLIFYRINAENHVEIVRVLHERMDVDSHLPE